MEILIKENKSIFDVIAQYYGESMESNPEILFTFIEDNKENITNLFDNYKGLTISLRDDLLNEFQSNIKSWSPPLGDPLTEIENITFTNYLKYGTYSYITSEIDILGASLTVDLDYGTPSIVNYRTRSGNNAVITTNRTGTIISPIGNGSTSITYTVNLNDGNSDIYGNGITVTNQEYDNISLKSQLSATGSYGDLFFSEFNSKTFLKDGATESDLLTTANYDLDPNGAYYSDVMPSFLGTNSLFRPLADEAAQALNVSWKNNFKINYYPNLCIENTGNDIIITNYDTTGLTGSDLTVYPTYLGQNIALDTSPISFFNNFPIDILDNTLSFELLYETDTNFTVNDENGTAYTAYATGSSIIINNKNSLVTSSEFTINSTSTINISGAVCLVPIFRYLEPTQVEITSTPANIPTIDGPPSGEIVLEMVNLGPERELTVVIGGTTASVVLPATTGDTIGDTTTLRIKPTTQFSEITVVAAADAADIIFTLSAVEPVEVLKPTQFNPTSYNEVDINLVNDSGNYALELNSTSAGNIEINGNSKTLTAGYNDLIITNAGGTFSTLGFTFSGNTTISGLTLSRTGSNYPKSDPIVTRINLQENNIPSKQVWNLFTLNYSTDGLEYYFNGSPIRYVKVDGTPIYNINGEFTLPGGREFTIDDNVLLIDNIDNSLVDMVTLDSFTLSRADIQDDFLKVKYNNPGFIYNPGFEL